MTAALITDKPTTVVLLTSVRYSLIANSGPNLDRIIVAYAGAEREKEKKRETCAQVMTVPEGRPHHGEISVREAFCTSLS
jgi:hypothetical protein